MKTVIERQILFNAPMVRALLDGSKTQTRRIVKPMASQGWLSPDDLCKSPRAKPVLIKGEQWGQFAHPVAGQMHGGVQVDEWSPLTCIRSPYGQPGDRLWVRESWQLHSTATDLATVVYAASSRQSWTEMHRLFPVELASGLKAKPFQEGWRPSIHMPRWASRILLEIVSVRIERLQGISETDALAEGMSGCTLGQVGRVDRYRHLWETINGLGSWDVNPWVWVVEFKQVKDE